MTVEEIKSSLNGLSISDIKQKYSKTQLEIFYKALFGISPATSYSKERLADTLRNFIEDEKRTADLSKILVY